MSQAALEEELRIELGEDDNEHNITMTRATTRMENRFPILRIRLGIISCLLQVRLDHVRVKEYPAGLK